MIIKSVTVTLSVTLFIVFPLVKSRECMTGVILWFMWKQQCPVCRAVTMDTTYFPWLHKRCAHPPPTNKKKRCPKATAWTSDKKVKKKEDFYRNRNVRLLSLLCSWNLWNVSRIKTSLIFFTESARLEIQKRNTTDIRQRKKKKTANWKKNELKKSWMFAGLLPTRPVAQSKAGSPKSCGSKSSIVLSRNVASVVRLRSRFSSGTMTTCMPAASPAFTPLGASSNTKHWVKGRDREQSAVILGACGRPNRFDSCDKVELWNSRWIYSEEFIIRSVFKCLFRKLIKWRHHEIFFLGKKIFTAIHAILDDFMHCTFASTRVLDWIVLYYFQIGKSTFSTLKA